MVQLLHDKAGELIDTLFETPMIFDILLPLYPI